MKKRGIQALLILTCITSMVVLAEKAGWYGVVFGVFVCLTSLLLITSAFWE